MYGKKKAIENILILSLDLTCLIIALGIGFGVRYGMLFGIYEAWDRQWVLGLFLGVYVALTILLDPYHHFFRRGPWEEMKQVLKSVTLLYLVVLACLYLSHQSGELSRLVSVYFLAANFMLTYAGRLAFKLFMLKKYRHSRYSSRLLLVTGMVDAEKAITNILRYNEWFRQLIGVVLIDDPGLDFVAGIPVVADRNTFLDYTAHHGVDEVFITGNMLSDFPTLTHWISELGQMGILVNINISAFDIAYTGKKTLGRVGKYAVVAFARNIFSMRQIVMKRTLDILGSLIGMFILGLSTLIVGPLIKADSPGPIFFKQTRVGRNGREFTFYKFRSMYIDAEQRKHELELAGCNEVDGPMFKMENDPRVTRMGKFLRRTSIDELPQFWNVLKGDMSLVGTRPPTVDEFKQYEAKHRCRLSMTPGLTGLWQVSGRSDIKDFDEVVQLDMEYIDNWSIWKDIQILLMTIGVVIKGTGSR
jgi:exopolysaccharide biosynthesis polyprenyl glycosylphosphotransferase